MHTFTWTAEDGAEWRIHFNSDMSGEAIVQASDETAHKRIMAEAIGGPNRVSGFRLPAGLLAAFSREAAIDEVRAGLDTLATRGGF